MKANNFNLHRYLERIGFCGEAKPDIETVREMMRCQLFTVPFENLDVQARKVVSLVPEEIVEKIIECKRGGYYYEVNGIFAMALDALGIMYEFVAARPMFYPVRRPKTHMAIVANLGNHKLLCDLGFGSYGIREPMSLTCLDDVVQQDSDFFRLTKDNDNYLLEAISEGEWAKQYEFNLSPQEWIDFVPANYLNSTHPDAVFVQKLLVVLHNHEGRKILFGDVLKTVQGSKVSKSSVANEALSSTLLAEFGLVYPS